jgi:glycosyltransferase involved in cell wall biosynthesis
VNILQLSPQFPFSESDGGKKSIVMFYKGFRNEGHNVTFVCYHDSIEQYEDKSKNIYCICHSTKNTLLRKILAIFLKKPLYLHKHYSQKLKTDIVETLEGQSFDIIHADHTAMAEMAIELGAHYNIPVVLRLHNIEWKIWERYYERLSKFSLARYYIQRQSKLLKKMEINLCERVNVCLTITDKDKELIQKYVHTPFIVTKPFGVKTLQEQGTFSSCREQFTLMMATNWAWRHNIEGAEWFIVNVLPILQKSIPEAKLLLLGKYLPKNFLDYSGKNVECVGFVENISDYYNCASLFISPLFVGSGIRIKILESLSFGVPVVATSIGAEGIELSEKDGLFIRDEPTEQASLIIDLLHKPDEINKLGERAKYSVQEKYNVQTIIRQTLEIYQNTIEKFRLQ